MKTFVLFLAFAVAFTCGILAERGRYRIDTVTNPFGTPSIEQQSVIDKMNWLPYYSGETEYQVDVLADKQ